MDKTNGGIDTSKERRSAVRKAWTAERNLVRQGQGTRDWTPEQQKTILEGKTPKDEQGRSYEGHHMQSVSNNKELAGDPKNIQFLTHDEHIQGAHQGNTKNATQGYYDPDTKKLTNVNDKDYKAPTPKELTNPICTREVSDGKEADKTASYKSAYKGSAKETTPPSQTPRESFAESAKSSATETQSSSAFAESARSASAEQTTGSSQSASAFSRSAQSTGASESASQSAAGQSQSNTQGR